MTPDLSLIALHPACTSIMSTEISDLLPIAPPNYMRLINRNDTESARHRPRTTSLPCSTLAKPSIPLSLSSPSSYGRRECHTAGREGPVQDRVGDQAEGHHRPGSRQRYHPCHTVTFTFAPSTVTRARLIALSSMHCYRDRSLITSQ
jgi:hypothetical protein